MVEAQMPWDYAPQKRDAWFNGKIRVKDSLGVDGIVRITGATTLATVTQDTVIATKVRSSTLDINSTSDFLGEVDMSDSLTVTKNIRTTLLDVNSTSNFLGAATFTDTAVVGMGVRTTLLDVNSTSDFLGAATFNGGVIHSATGTITHGALTHGTDVFTTTAETDTVTISGASVNDIYVVSAQWTAGVDQQDILEWEPISTGLVVHRMAAGESALKYSWFRVK